MNHWLLFLTSPECHLILSFVTFAALLNVPMLRRTPSFKFGLTSAITLVWFEAIYLPLGFCAEPGYGILSVLTDAYDGVMPPVIPFAVLLVGGLISFVCLAISSGLDSKTPTVTYYGQVQRPLRGPRTYH